VSPQDDFVIVHITTKDEAEAHKLATMLLEKKKAACVNVVPEINTLYRWEGKIETGTESLMIVKTSRSLLSDIITLVKASHSYKVPEIIAFPVTGGSPEYLAWLEDEISNG
jgi:periplasmic divalent cation tolerance protein